MKNKRFIKVFITTLLLSLSMSVQCFCLGMTGEVELPLSAADWSLKPGDDSINLDDIDWDNYRVPSGIANPKAMIENDVSFTRPNTSYDDKTLLTDNSAWMTLTEQEQFVYALGYLSQINTLLGVSANYYPAGNVHMMPVSDPNYSLCCAYTDYGTKQIYINMNMVNKKADGGWTALFTLAHETRHLYQNTFQTLPYDSNANLNNMAAYNNDPREIDANNFARMFVNAVLKNVGSNLAIQ